jgi:hypothetical protein
VKGNNVIDCKHIMYPVEVSKTRVDYCVPLVSCAPQ